MVDFDAAKERIQNDIEDLTGLDARDIAAPLVVGFVGAFVSGLVMSPALRHDIDLIITGR